MANHRDEKITSRIRELAATFIEKEGGISSLITVTGVEMSPDGRNAKILITALPADKEQAAYGFVKRNLGEMRTFIMKQLKIHPIPYLDVAIDLGEKNRQKIDELLKNG